MGLKEGSSRDLRDRERDANKPFAIAQLHFLEVVLQAAGRGNNLCEPCLPAFEVFGIVHIGLQNFEDFREDSPVLTSEDIFFRDFQGCCNDCHQTAQRNHIEDPNEQISLAMCLEFAPELGPDVLSTETIARQKDDLAGKMSPESRRKAFCGLDSRAEIPHICLKA